jgi:hypothetical protein
MASAPSAMKMPRRMSASTMPISSTFWRYSRGTANLLMISTKMNRLSTESEYSVIQPAKNSPPYCGPATVVTPSPNSMASVT